MSPADAARAWRLREAWALLCREALRAAAEPGGDHAALTASLNRCTGAGPTRGVDDHRVFTLFREIGVVFVGARPPARRRLAPALRSFAEHCLELFDAPPPPGAVPAPPFEPDPTPAWTRRADIGGAP